MHKKYTLLLCALLLVALTAAGCLDMFSVPGVALSPDGSKMVFLSGLADLMKAGSGEGVQPFTLTSLDIATGESTNIAGGGDDKSAITAFDVNPVNGDVAYMLTTEETGTAIMLSSGGVSKEFISQSALGAVGLGTMMRFSPDGSKLAFSMLTLPEGMTLKQLQDMNGSQLPPEMMKNLGFVVFIADMNSGAISTVSDRATQRANTIAWSPSGNRLAYNAWVDDNKDGTIATVPNLNPQTAGQPGDTSKIFVYDLGSNTTTATATSTIDFGQVFLSEDKIAYISVDAAKFATGGLPSVNVFNVADGSSTPAYTPAGVVLSISVSPDHQQIAWVETPPSLPGASSSTESLPGEVYVAGTDFASPRKVATLPKEMQYADSPIWMPDGKAVLVAVSNPLSSLITTLTAAFSGGSDATSEAPKAPPVLKIDVASGETTTVYSGGVVNSSFYSALFGLATSGALSQLVQPTGQ